MNCLKAKEQFSAYLEDELDYQTIRELETHLDTCESCRREFTPFRESLDLLHRLPQIEPSTGFNAALRARLADIQVEPVPFWRRVLPPFYSQSYLALSGVAVLLVMVAGFYFYQTTLTQSQSAEIIAASETSRRTPVGEVREVEWQQQQFPLAVPSRELQSLVNFSESSVFNRQSVRRNQQSQSPAFNLQSVHRTQQQRPPALDLQPVRRSQRPQQLEQNYILQTINYTEAPTGGGL